MLPTDYIPDVRSRIDDARDYIDDFKLKAGRFFDGHPYSIVSEEEAKGETKIVRYRFIVLREVPAGLRAPVRSCISDLRESLDNLVWGLSQVVGASPSCKIAFPVCLSEFPTTPKDNSAFQTWVRCNQAVLSKFPAGAEALIRNLQPFNTYDGSDMGHPVYVLNKLCNQKKHKMPFHIAGVHQIMRIGVDYLTLQKPHFITLPSQAIENNAVVLELSMPTRQSAQGNKPHLPVYIAFDKDSPAPNAPVYEFLINMHRFVRDEVVAKFEPFFPK